MKKSEVKERLKIAEEHLKKVNKILDPIYEAIKGNADYLDEYFDAIDWLRDGEDLEVVYDELERFGYFDEMEE